MPTFYDPIELEDIDIDDSTANFYIIHVRNGNYKFCATTQNLDSPNLRAGDPETRARTYWPITREQLNQPGAIAALFPASENNKIRTSTMKVDELERVLHFNPIEQQQRVFGQRLMSIGEGWETGSISDHGFSDVDPNEPQHNAQPITWETILPEDASEEQRYTWTNMIIQHLVDQNVQIEPVMLALQDDHIAKRRFLPFLLSIRNHDIPIPALTGIDPGMLYELIRNHDRIGQDFTQGTYTVQEYVDLLASFQTYMDAHDNKSYVFQLLVPNSFALARDEIARSFIVGIRNEFFDHRQLFDAIFNGPDRMRDISRVNAFKACMPAILAGETTLDALQELTIDELKIAAESGEYPGHEIGLGH